MKNTKPTEVLVNGDWIKILDLSDTRTDKGTMIWFEVPDGSGTETRWAWAHELPVR